LAGKKQIMRLPSTLFLGLLLLSIGLLQSCSSLSPTSSASKIPVYAWDGGLNDKTDDEVLQTLSDWKAKGVDTLMYNGGQDPADYARIGKLAEAAGLGLHAWIPTMVQKPRPELKPEWYAVNRAGESAYDKPAYVPYYTFLCPNEPGVYQFLEELYTSVAEVEQVAAVHLDYIRFPDVILARGLWEKYGLVMDKEYPKYDYCYCDRCTSGFEEQSGIDIKSLEDPTQVQAWKQYRYDLITSIVNRLAEQVHAQDKRINAAVFPGPHSVAKRIVRQEWDQWDLDQVFPMLYNDFYLEDVEWIGEMTAEGVEALDGRASLISGLFICPDPKSKARQPDPENHGLIPEELGAAVQVSMDNGAAGICLFTPGRMTKKHWRALRRAIYR